ncbi:histidine kinase dimerization/phosphoacceptor domain -containing protein, partial [Flavobacterium sp.]|uniref:tetratricopeptide repeat-containing sensor histidine kinase n=1 Tax=Flavobacterium sp. TaxID=239 RepID=UPI003752FE32
HYRLGNLFINSNEPEKALLHFKTSKKLFFEIKDWDNYFMATCSLTGYLTYCGNYTATKELLAANLKIAQAQKNNKNLTKIYQQYSKLYNYLCQYKEALFYAKKSLILESDSSKRAGIYYNIAVLYTNLENYPLALSYIDKSLELSDSDAMKCNRSVQKIDILILVKRYSQALAIGLDNKKFFENKNIKDMSALGNDFSIATCYYHLKKYDLAEVIINKLFAEVNLPNDFQISINNLASSIYLETNKKKEAKIYIDTAISLLQPEDNFETKLKLYITKYKVEQALGNFETALLYNIKQTEIKDAKSERRNKYKLDELQVGFNVAAKDINIKELKIAQLQKTVENKKQQENLLYVSVALLLALLSTFFYVRNNRAIKNKNKIIELTNIKLENEKLLTQKSLVEKETLLKEIHHRVKNNMQLVMSLLNIQAQEANNNISDFVAVSQSRILSMSLIHENLYQTDNLSQVDFKKYVENLTNSILNAYSNVNTTITLKLEIEPVYFDIQKAIPLGLIINELVNNAYKHAFINNQKGLITLQLIRKNEKYELVVSDNGIGIQKKENAKKTLGLELVEELVFQLDGLLKVASDKGMQYIIQF